ncbi:MULTISPECIES: OmpH family outer membrane protein [unclassified Ruegeria]|uniref:OmpH family outer membrane protein n=1 Tax=unclassified Ruegeria TaxID=2625375 RepID=UPI0020C47E5F|nr:MULTISPECIES: OmpH family outer membrane protein [unclassified Ruegeria]
MTIFLAGFAQAQQLGVPQTAVLTISSERLFADSEFGQRVLREIEAEGTLLAEENERIVAELSREEKDLTEQRAELPPEEFRPLAEAFDEKVQSHRDGQRAKLDALARRSEEAQQMFFELIQPVLIDLLRESGATVIIERSSVFLSSDRTDVTESAIARINVVIGDGSTIENQANE